MSRSATGRGRAVAAGAGLVVLAAVGVVAVSLVSAVPAAVSKRTPLPTTSAGVTTFSGTVQSGAARLAGVRVGFWSRTGHVVVSTTTSAKGTFTLHVPSGVRGFAYAGARPDAPAAVFALQGRSYVRGVIGAMQPAGTAYRIHQGHASAVPARLGGGQALRFDLQRPGTLRVESTRYFTDARGFTSGLVELVRRDGSGMGALELGRNGVWTSRPVVPGAYLLRAQPVSPYLGRTWPITVRAGVATVVAPSFGQGVAVRGTVTAGTAPAADVRVVLERAGREVLAAITDRAGRYALPLVAPGAYRLRFAHSPRPRAPLDLEPEFDVAGSSSFDYRPAAKDVTLRGTGAAPVVDMSLQRADAVAGTVKGLRGIEFGRVWLEDETRTVVRTAGTDGEDFAKDVRGYRLGGLVAGRTYTVLSARDRLYGAATFAATTGTASQPVTVDTPALTLRGSAPAAGRGTVEVRAQGTALPRLGASAKIDATGHYVVRGLLPAAYEVRAVPPDLNERLPSPWQRITLDRSTTLDLTGGTVEPGTWRGRFVSGAAPVPGITLSAVSAAGERALFSASAADGRVQEGGMRPGTYRYQRSSVAEVLPGAVTRDGPWWYAVPTGTFTIRGGAVTDVGDVALHVHAR